ncbi:MAG TPA: D-glycerate dehydrogenase [Thermoanaerobaculia bacterium]|nr:D-glycerate dehydrogenase [Thermoanaerobaculia bacterium]
MAQRQTVVITAELPSLATAILSRKFDVVAHPSVGPRSEQALITLISEADAAITLLSDPVTRRVLESNPNLRIVANYAVGVDNVDLRAAAELGVVVTNTPGVLTDATADMTLALLLAAARRIVEGDRLVRAGEFHGWTPLMLLGASLRGKRLGILGMGRIGGAVAARARGFGLEIIYHSRSGNSEVERATGARLVALDELLRTSDFVSVHTPLTPETRHLIDASALGMMKSTAYLINTARGSVIDEPALAEALRTGRLRGAALDVYESEPSVHPALLRLDNVVLLPHLGSATVETRNEMARIAAENVVAVLDGLPPLNPVSQSDQDDSRPEPSGAGERTG